MRPENQNIIDYNAVGDRIQKERIKCGFTPKDLAEFSNVSLSAVNEIERGIRRVGLTNLVLIARTLNVGVEYLLFGKKEETSFSRREIKASVLLKECTEEEQDAILQIVATMVKVFADNRERAHSRLTRPDEGKKD
mgnify:FL=1